MRNELKILSLIIICISLYSNLLFADEYLDPRWSSGDFKGFNLDSSKNSRLKREHVKELKSMGANLVRVIVEVSKNDSAKYKISPSDATFLRNVVDYCSENDISVVVALEIQPAGDKADYWLNDDVKSQVGVIWQELASLNKGNKTIVGFDLLNEPVLPQIVKAFNKDIWRDWAVSWISKIREVDASRTVIFEVEPWALPSGFANLKPLNFKNVVYSFHSYSPQKLTHQGINGYKLGINYPINEDTGFQKDVWNFTRLENLFSSVVKFKNAYNVPIYVGEFSIINYADLKSRVKYMTDSIDLFSLNNFSWTYHAYKEWKGWDPEYISGETYILQSGQKVNNIMELLKIYFKQSQSD